MNDLTIYHSLSSVLPENTTDDSLVSASPPTTRRNATLPEGANDDFVIDMWLRSHRSPKTSEAAPPQK